MFLGSFTATRDIPKEKVALTELLKLSVHESSLS